MEDEYVNTRESDLRWESHEQLHKDLQDKVDVAKAGTDASLKVALEDHHREHAVHEKSHEREHQFTKDALEKSDQSLEKRLESMNEFRSQLQGQAATFLSKEVFEQFVKERNIKLEDVQNNITERHNALILRHENDILAVRKELQDEREHRKTFEGSVNTFKYIVGLFGISGIAGIIYFLANN